MEVDVERHARPDPSEVALRSLWIDLVPQFSRLSGAPPFSSVVSPPLGCRTQFQIDCAGGSNTERPRCGNQGG